MIRAALLAFWVCLVVAASAFGWVQFGSVLNPQAPSSASTNAKGKARETIQARQISTPVFKDGVVDGYFVMRFSIVTAPGANQISGVKVDDITIDEALRQLPSVSTADVQLGVQPAALAKAVAGAVNARLGASVIEEILFKEFTFVAARDARR